MWILDDCNKTGFFPVDKYSNILTGLHQSVIEGNLEETQFYLDHLQHDINPPCRREVSNFSVTPLHYAAQYGHLEILKLYHENLPDMSISNKNEANALHYAAVYGHLEGE